MVVAHRFTNDPVEVSARMRLIRGKGTKPELELFSILSATGIPFQSHIRVSGVSVDAVVNGRVLLFVDSPFWHFRDTDELKRLSSYWQGRLRRNRKRDRRQSLRLRAEGFTVIRFWADKLDQKRVVSRVRSALTRARNGESSGLRGDVHG